MAQTNVTPVTRETLTGDRTGVDYVAVVGGGVTREVMSGTRVGHDWYADVISASRDVLTGDKFGQDIYASIASAVRETLIKEPPYRAMHASREVLVSMTNESLSVARMIKSYRQSAVQKRPAMALPSTVHSPRNVATYREQVVLAAVRSWARSTDFAATLRMQVISHRITPAAPTVKSNDYVGVYRELVVQSRGIAYVPVSELRVSFEGQQVVQHRNSTPPNQVRTTIKAATLVQQYIASRATTVVVITTEVDAFTLVEQTIQASGKAAPHSPIDNAFLTEMVVQQRSVVPPNSGENVVEFVQQAVRMRDLPVPPHGPDHVASFVQQTVTPRDVLTNRSTTSVSTSVELAVLHRETYAPAYAMGRHTRTLREQVVQQRLDSSVKRRSPIYASVLRLTFTLGRTTPKPWDVIDPAIGRHAATLTMLSLLHRDTTPPGTISRESRYVFNLVEQSVIRDTFPAPDYPPPVIPEQDVGQVVEQAVIGDSDWGPVSAATAIQVVGQVVVGDNSGWIDATVPTSEIRVFEVFEGAVVNDAFPPADMAQADAEVAGLVEAVALGDSTFPNSMIPQSAIQARTVAELAAVGDAQFPNPMIPASAVQSSLVGAAVAVRDPSMQGNFGMSEIEVWSVLEFALIRDPTLVGIPRRTGPRPIVTVSMS